MRRASTIPALGLAALLAACGATTSEVRRSSPPVARAAPTAGCSPMTYGGEGRPRYLMAFVGPFQGAFSDHGIQNSQAVRLVLADRGWKAGAQGVAVQVCDESSTREPIDVPKCERTGRALAANPSVVAVVGPTTSGCAAAMLPALNRAGIPLVGLGNTYVGLTRRGPGVAAGHPHSLYPTGVRTYLRLAPADDAQAAGAVLAARRAGAARTFALFDDTDYGRGSAASFQETARRLGLTPVGLAHWNGDAGGYSALVRRIRRSGADAVFVAGYITSNGPRLIRDLRTGLGPKVAIVAPDGFNQPTAIVEGAGAGAEGVMITLSAAPVGALPAAGRAWATEFRRRYGARPCCYSVYAGQATRSVLDAIAGSNGSRAGVLARLRGTRVRGGLLGDFAFDRYGDSTLTTVALYRIASGRLRFVQTVKVPRALLTRR